MTSNKITFRDWFKDFDYCLSISTGLGKYLCWASLTTLDSKIWRAYYENGNTLADAINQQIILWESQQ